MEDIRFYNFEFKLLCIESLFLSVNWRIKYNEVGQFEAHFPLTSEVFKIVAENPYLVAVQGKQAAIVTGFQAMEDLAVFGRSLNWLFTKRIVPDFEPVTGTVGKITCDLVENAFLDVENFVVDGSLDKGEEVSFSQKEYRTLADVVKECLKLQGAGHEVQFDPQHKLWIYRVVIGQEQPVMVSEDNRNVTATEWSSDLLDLCTAGWYQQKQESTEENRETGAIWTFADSEKEEGIYRWDCLLQGETEAEALQDLSQKTKTSKIVAQNADLAWHTDYELGDMVRVQVKKGDLLQTAKKRVIGVHLWYEEGQKGEQPEFESDEEA